MKKTRPAYQGLRGQSRSKKIDLVYERVKNELVRKAKNARLFGISDALPIGLNAVMVWIYDLNRQATGLDGPHAHILFSGSELRYCANDGDLEQLIAFKIKQLSLENPWIQWMLPRHAD